MKVTALFEYPVKGLRANRIPCASVNKRGLAMDRRWMLVDEEGTFLSQRSYPVFTQFTVTFDKSLILKFLPTEEEINIEMEVFENPLDVSVWGQTCTSHVASDDINAWISNRLDRNVRLVYMKTEDIRPVESSSSDDIVSFADGYPVLLASEKSLSELNARLEMPIGIERFRSNIVIDGKLPYEEDGWQTLKIGPVTFRMVKLCARCHVINIDQDTGMSSDEPLRTLSTYRKDGNRVNFAVNLIPTAEGIIHEGDEIVIID